MTSAQTTAMANPRNGMGQVCHIHPIDAGVQNHISQIYWDWMRLYAADVTACPLQHPDVVLADLAHLRTTPLVPLLITAQEATTTQAITALIPKSVSTRRLGAFPFGQQLHGWRLAGNGVLSDSSSGALTAVVQQTLKQVVSTGAAFLLMEDLDVESTLAQALNEVLPQGWTRFHHAGIQPRRRIHLPTKTDDYWSKFSSKTRQTFRRKLKKFGSTRLECLRDVGDVPRFLEVAHRISLQTWQTRQFGLRIRNDAAELAQYTKLAELGLLRCYLWFVEDQAVAFTVGNQDHGCFHYEEVGYLSEYAKHSPGQMMLIQMIDDLIQHDPAEWFDFGGGDADYKELFANHTSQSGTVWLLPPTLSGRATAAHLQWCQWGRKTVRKAIEHGGLTTRFRQWVRYGRTTTTASEANPQPETTHQ
ncbi:GNAT family N-acetyltransferase [bacterium]|nr:GNAT family N-acetyltransferase [bacterium]